MKWSLLDCHSFCQCFYNSSLIQFSGINDYMIFLQSSYLSGRISAWLCHNGSAVFGIPPCADWMVILPSWWFFTMLTTDHETGDLLILLLQVSVVTCHVMNQGLSTEPDHFFLRFSYLQWQGRIFLIFFCHASQTTNCLVISSCLLLFSYPFFFLLVLNTLRHFQDMFLGLIAKLEMSLIY